MNIYLFNRQKTSLRQTSKNSSLARAVFLASFALLPGLATAEVKVCNQYPETVYAAVGYQTATGVTTEGWWKIASGKCTLVYDKPVSDPFYIHSHTAWWMGEKRIRTRRQWGGDERLAVNRLGFHRDQANVVETGDAHEELKFMNKDELGNGRTYDIEYTIESDGTYTTTRLRPTDTASGRIADGFFTQV